MTRAIICGGRDYKNRARVFQILDAARDRLGLDFLIQGGADGADYLGWQWSDERGVRCGSFNADWKKHGKKAGPIRNARMIADGKPDFVIAFPGGFGTMDMVQKAEQAGIRVIKVDWA